MAHPVCGRLCCPPPRERETPLISDSSGGGGGGGGSGGRGRGAPGSRGGRPGGRGGRGDGEGAAVRRGPALLAAAVHRRGRVRHGQVRGVPGRAAGRGLRARGPGCWVLSAPWEPSVPRGGGAAGLGAPGERAFGCFVRASEEGGLEL